MRLLAVLLVSLSLAACGSDDTSPVTAGDAATTTAAQDPDRADPAPPDPTTTTTTTTATTTTTPGEERPPQRYTASATVLESRDHGPQLCLGGVATSLPPQCGGPDIVGWDWSLVDDEESASGTTWGTYSVVGTWDGSSLTLTEPPGPPVHQEGSGMDFSTPCDPPPGGWAVTDESKATQEGLDSALSYANGQADFAGAWLDQSINPAAQQEPVDHEAMNDPTKLVLNLRFTGNLQAHESAVRSVWGGPLCITEARHRLDELRSIQQQLQGELDALSSSVNEVTGVVEVTVIVAEEDTQQQLDERYGEGVVQLTGALQPVGSG